MPQNPGAQPSLVLNAAADHSQHQQLPGNLPEWLCPYWHPQHSGAIPSLALLSALSQHNQPSSAGDVGKLLPPGHPGSLPSELGTGEEGQEDPRSGWGLKHRVFQYFLAPLIP